MKKVILAVSLLLSLFVGQAVQAANSKIYISNAYADGKDVIISAYGCWRTSDTDLAPVVYASVEKLNGNSSPLWKSVLPLETATVIFAPTKQYGASTKNQSPFPGCNRVFNGNNSITVQEPGVYNVGIFSVKGLYPVYQIVEVGFIAEPVIFSETNESTNIESAIMHFDSNFGFMPKHVSIDIGDNNVYAEGIAKSSDSGWGWTLDMGNSAAVFSAPVCQDLRNAGFVNEDGDIEAPISVTGIVDGTTKTLYQGSVYLGNVCSQHQETASTGSNSRVARSASEKVVKSVTKEIDGKHVEFDLAVPHQQ